MTFVRLIVTYTFWHYTSAFVDGWRVFTNFVWFIYNYFSISLLSRTLFSPWRRLQENQIGKSRVGSFFSNLVINFIMRLVGFLIRAVTLIFGGLTLLAMIPALVVVIILWVGLPVLMIFLLLEGIPLILY